MHGYGILALSFLFWNLDQKPVTPSLGRLVARHSADVLCVSECIISDAELIDEMNRATALRFQRAESIAGFHRLRVFSRYSSEQFFPVFEDPTERLGIYRLILSTTDLLIGVIHGASKSHFNDHAQLAEAQRLSSQIRLIEEMFGHRRTVVIGDFNMNPFDPGMVIAHGFHAVMTRKIAEENLRTVQQVRYPFFYNPMWGHMGDRTPGPPGTHYYRDGNPLVYFWNTLDQVLLRPELLPHFHDELEILNHDGAVPLADGNGQPNRRTGSDHFPLFCRIHVE